MHQFKSVVQKLESSVTITFPMQYSRQANELNQRFPGTVTVAEMSLLQHHDEINTRWADDEELELLTEEWASFGDDFARSNEEGWFYGDDDEDPWEPVDDWDSPEDIA